MASSFSVLAAMIAVALLCVRSGSGELVWRALEMQGTPPAPRCDHSAVYYPNDGRIYIFGGYNESDGPYDDFFTLDVATKTWTQLNLAGDAPTKRSGAFQGIVGSRLVIGYGSVGPSFLNDLFYVDLDAQPRVWAKVVITNPDDAPSKRAWPTSGTYKGRLVFFAGLTEDPNDQNDMYLLNVTSWTWEKLSYVCPQSGLVGNIYTPTTSVDRVPRRDATCSVDRTPTVDTLARQSIAALGSGPYATSKPASLTAFLIDQRNNIDNYTTEVEGYISTALTRLAAANVSDQASVDAALANFTSMWQPLAGSSEKAGFEKCGDYFCPIVSCTLPPREIGGRIVTLGNDLLVLDGNQCNTQGTGGGYDCYIDGYYAFNVPSRTWRKVATTGDSTMDTKVQNGKRPPVANFRYPAAVGQTIFDFGGAFRDSTMDWFYYNDVWALDTTTWVWSTVKVSGQPPSPTWSHTMFSVNGSLVVFGGCKSPNLFFNTVYMLSDMTLSAKNAYAVGDGVVSGAVAVDSSFQVFTRDLQNKTLTFGGRQVSAFGFDTSGSTFQGRVIDSGKGFYNVTYQTTQAGRYRLTVKVDLVDIPGSPFDVTVAPGAPVASSSSIVGRASFEPVVGVSSKLTVAINDRFNNRITAMPEPFNVSVEGPTPSSHSVSLNADGLYVIACVFEAMGVYNISVRLQGVDIGYSPFLVTVVTAGTVSSKGASVGAIAGGVVGAFALFALIAISLGCIYARRRERALKADYAQTQLDYHEITFQERIGQGSFGEVYKARFRNTIVAVKVIRLRASQDNESKLSEVSAPHTFNALDIIPMRLSLRPSTDAQSLERESREAREMLAGEIDVMCRLRHPNLLLYMGATRQPKICIVTEFMEMGSVQQLLLTKRIDLPWLRRLGFLVDAARGVAYLHACTPPVLHCDLKCANLLVSANWVVKVADFGLSRFKRPTSNGETFGTLFWMSPEVAAGLACTEKSDTFSFAIMMWEVATRKLPYRGLLETLKDPEEDFIALLIEKNLRPTVPVACPQPFTLLMTACWQRSMVRRKSMSEVVDALEAMMASEQRGSMVHTNVPLFSGDDSIPPEFRTNHTTYSLDRSVVF
eukprot:Opistho-2@37671